MSSVKFRFFLALVIFFVGLAFLLKTLFLDSYPDFRLNYYGAMAVRGGQNPYLGGPNFFTPFNYPPPVLLLFLPLSFLPIGVAERLWTILSLGALIGSLILLLKAIRVAPTSTTGLLLLGFSFSLFPVKFTLGMGQINHIVLLLIVLTLFFLQKKNDTMAGICLGLSLAMKLFPVFLIIYFLIKKNWTALIAALATIVTIELLALVAVPLEYHQFYLTKVLPPLITSWKEDYYNQSLSGLLMRSVSSGEMRSTLRYGITALMASITIIMTWLQPGNKFNINPKRVALAELTNTSTISGVRVAGVGGPPRRGPLVGFLGGKRLTGPAPMGFLRETPRRYTKKSDENIFCETTRTHGQNPFDTVHFVLFLTTNVLLNTFSWQHHFVWLIPAFFIVFKQINLQKKKNLWLFILGLSYLLVAGNLKNPSHHLPFFLSPYLSVIQSHVFFGGLLLWGILALNS